jgi:hypothetical protein
VTDLREAERLLRESNERLRQAIVRGRRIFALGAATAAVAAGGAPVWLYFDHLVAGLACLGYAIFSTWQLAGLHNSLRGGEALLEHMESLDG